MAKYTQLIKSTNAACFITKVLLRILTWLIAYFIIGTLQEAVDMDWNCADLDQMETTVSTYRGTSTLSHHFAPTALFLW